MGTPIVAGDTLCGVAGRLGVSAEALARANGLPSVEAPLLAGTTLDVPKNAPLLYAVRSGDTLTGIGRWTGLPATTLAETNALRDPDLLSIGQRLVVPAGARTACAPPLRVAQRTGPTGSVKMRSADAPRTPPVSSAPPEQAAPASAASDAEAEAAFARSVAAQARRLYEQADFEGAADVARSVPDWSGAPIDDPLRKAGAEAALYEGLALAGLGRDDEARSAFARSLEADPDITVPEPLASPPVRNLFDEAAPQTMAGSET
jgi:LysM repeat protein